VLRIINNFLTRQLDLTNPDSAIAKVRKKRCLLLRELISILASYYGRRIKILDVGGTPQFWQFCGLAHHPDIMKIVLVNVERLHSDEPSIECVLGDGRNLSFGDEEFDLVVSNSVIEHVGSLEDQRRMAEEISRVGRHYFVQTPNFYFPIEPHYAIPLFQFLPRSLKKFLIKNLSIGRIRKTNDEELINATINRIRLLKPNEMRMLFPEGIFCKEKIFNITNSYVILGRFGELINCDSFCTLDEILEYVRSGIDRSREIRERF